MSTIKPDPKPKNNQNLTPEKPLKNLKPKNNQNLTPEKPLKNPKPKNNQNLTPEKPLKNPKPKNNQNLTPEKPLKNPKPKNNQNLASKNKERIGIIKEELKELAYKLSKLELKEIKRRLYINSKKHRKYLDELHKKILKLDRYHQDYDDLEYRGIKDLRDLFKLSINEDYYKPTLAKSGFNNNYTQYESKGDKILTLEEYLALIEQYLRELIDYYKNKGEWKVQLIADINRSLKPGSDETHVMYTKSDNIEIRIGGDINDVIKELFNSLLKRYQEHLQEKMRGSELGFDGVNLLHHDFNKIRLNRGYHI